MEDFDASEQTGNQWYNEGRAVLAVFVAILLLMDFI
jgi:hypothetical protein